MDSHEFILESIGPPKTNSHLLPVLGIAILEFHKLNNIDI